MTSAPLTVGANVSNSGIKQSYVEYRPAILLTLLLIALISVSIFRAEYLLSDTSLSSTAPAAEYVTSGIL